MADETLTGAKTDVTVDTAGASEARKKLFIKVAIIIVAAVIIFWLYKKFIK